MITTYDRPVASTAAPAPPLTAADRCDRCCAQAQFRVLLRTGELMFCSHHRHVYAEALAKLVQVPRSL